VIGVVFEIGRALLVVGDAGKGDGGDEACEIRGLVGDDLLMKYL